MLTDRCLSAFVAAGTLELSMDRLSSAVRVSKRMLIHYFGSRDRLELQTLLLLEERLRAQFSPQSFPGRLSAQQLITRLWERASAPEARGMLLLIMDISRRAWLGSQRARQFYAQQQELWMQLLLGYLPDRATVEAVLQSFQGAVLAYLISGDRQTARRALLRRVTGSSRRRSGKRARTTLGAHPRRA